MNNDGKSARDPRYFERFFIRGILFVLFLTAIVRLFGFLIVFNYTVLQMDFAAFYIAGKSVAQGLSPYVNWIETDPALWDNLAAYPHSRFLYPPLAARLFQLLAWMPYHTAKFVWILSSLIALSSAMILSFRLAGLRESMGNLLGVGTIVAVAYPTLTLFERGQVDGFILLSIMATLLLMHKGTRSALIGGGLLAFAALMKLNCLLLLPFFLIKRRWNVVLGFVAGGLLLLGISLVVDGPAAVSDYASTQLPRISEYGEGGPEELRLPREVFEDSIRGLGAGFARMDDRPYRKQMGRFVINATATQDPFGIAVRTKAEQIGIPLGTGGTALLFLGIFVLLTWFWQYRYGPLGGKDDPAGELAYWLLAMSMVLFCGPVSWVMSMVWLLPLSVFLLRQRNDLRGKGEVFALLVSLLGYLFVIMPDNYHNLMFSPFPMQWMNPKYIIGELLIIVGLLWFWRQRSLRPTDTIGEGEATL